MRFEIKEIAKNLGITVVYVTHDQTEAMAMSDRIFLINNGVVQQAGSPEEIYNRPANQFVADFLGKVEFHKGVAADGKIAVTEWGQSIDYPAMERTGKVEVAIRPENVRMVKGGDAQLTGTIETMYYLGDTTDYRVRVGKAYVRVIAEGFSHKEFAIGDKVGLNIREFIVFADDGSLEEQLKIKT